MRSNRVPKFNRYIQINFFFKYLSYIRIKERDENIFILFSLKMQAL